MKTKTLTVVHPIQGERVLEEKHALRLLAMPKNGGWTLKEEEPEKEDAGHSDDTEKARKPKKGK